MNATSGDWLRRAAPAAVIVVSLGLAACSGSDSKPAGDDPTSAAQSPDEAADDQAQIEKLATTIWSVRQQAFNSGEASRELFEGAFSQAATEVELAKAKQFSDQGIVRTGAPVITEIEATASGDKGEILLCLDEDDWDAEENGKVLDTPARGANPWGATVERSGDGWVFVQAIPTAEVEKKKSC